jgi:arylsulfatase
VRLELGVEGSLPGVFGAPQIHARSAPAPGWNVLFVSIDTLRADRVGARGGGSSATPVLDALARESLVFTDVTANAPYTLPAHATLFSGQFPSVHGVEDRDRLLSPRRSPILARELAARGWRTQAFAAGGFLAPELGFQAGFDGFSIADPLRHPGSAYFGEFARHYPDQDITRWTPSPGTSPVRSWLAAHAAEPFFLFLHTYEVHDYDPPPGTLACARTGCSSSLSDFRELLFPRKPEPFPGTEEDRAHLLHLYDAALRHVDAQLGELLDDLRRLGLLERTLVLVTSDHGEEWFERGRLQHGKTLYDELLCIPWILRVPGRAPRAIATPAMQVDVMPTLLGALGLPLDARMQGVDLLAGTPRPRPRWAEVDDKFASKVSLRAGAWKLVHGPPEAEVVLRNERAWELYDLAHDPGETRDLSGSEPARLAELQRQLEAFGEHLHALGEALGPVGSGAALDEGTHRLLEHLGY